MTRYQCAPPGGRLSGPRGMSATSRRSGSSASASGARSCSSAPRPCNSTSAPSGGPAAGRSRNVRESVTMSSHCLGRIASRRYHCICNNFDPRHADFPRTRADRHRALRLARLPARAPRARGPAGRRARGPPPAAAHLLRGAAAAGAGPGGRDPHERHRRARAALPQRPHPARGSPRARGAGGAAQLPERRPGPAGAPHRARPRGLRGGAEHAPGGRAAGVRRPLQRVRAGTAGRAVGAVRRCRRRRRLLLAASARSSKLVRMDDVIIVTTNELPGYEVVQVYGEVFGIIVRARNAFSNIGASFRTVFGGEAKGYTQLLADSRNQAVERLKDAARERGANAVLAMRFDCNEIADIMSEVAAYGTAVTVRKL